ncbi:MAG: hypothetical protein AAFN92_00740 [Bacteroidota bacterium]
MYKSLTCFFLSLFLAAPLTAQCDLVVEIGDITCDSVAGNLTALLVINGSDSVVRLPEFGLELPLPLEEVIEIPVFSFDTIFFYFESGPADAPCRETLLIVPPADCFAQPSNCPVSIEPEELDCGIPTRLLATPSGIPPFTYRWNTGDTTATIDYTLVHFDYAVTVTDAEGCVSSTSRFFGEVVPFWVHLASSGNPCAGDESPGLTATVGHAEGPFSYLWNTGETTRTITEVVPEQLYSVTVTDGAGCTATGQGVYHPGAFGQRLTVSGPTTTNCDGTPIVLRVDDPAPDFTYVWTTATDTLTGDSISITNGGYFGVMGIQDGNPSCRVFGRYNVTDISFEVDELSIVSFSDNCDSTVCLVVMNDDRGFLFGDHLVTWSSPNTGVLQQGFGQLCVSEPGLYQATVTTPCDTITLFTSIKFFPPCTDLCGSVVMDADGDCNPDGGEQDWSDMNILLTNDSTNISYLVMPDVDGSFCAPVPVGSYQMRSLNDEMTVSTSCELLRTRMEILPTDDVEMRIFAGLAPTEEENAVAGIRSGELRPEVNLTVFPNPSSGELQFDFRNAGIAPTDVLTVFDGLGRLRERITVAALTVPWRPANVSKGLYQVMLTDRAGRLKARASVVFR